MKSTVLFIAISLISLNSYSQTEKDSLTKIVRERIKNIKDSQSENPYYSKEEAQEDYTNEVGTFQALAQPAEDSDLANYFKIYLEKKLLKKIDFSAIKWSSFYKHLSNNKYNYTIRLTFELSKTGKATNCRINTGNKDVDRKVIEVFKKYPLEKLGLKESDKSGKISVQLFAKEDKDVLIKASKFAVVDEAPVIKGCEDLQFYWQVNKCLYEQLNEYIVQHISLKTLNSQELRGEIILRYRFTINETGKITKVNSIAPNKIIKDEIDRLIMSFNAITAPGKRNNIPKTTYCETYRTITIENLK
ncbi:hypothetical protein [Flavobacterium hungaricum]|uniref:TonB C-terminal domain-containing protein n=1 Tax=Flavobacterium hungaricum TaxID=2082725 RepID=A0ABR9TS28_9FLAO|nr:hypothetical protein [Flavobacterium hungaricum]MBE8728177.1 hypothetical protein [Flavobacterium hungaricum]